MVPALHGPPLGNGTKGRSTGRAIDFAATHGAVLVLLGAAWIRNDVRGPSPFIALHVAAGFTAMSSALTQLRELVLSTAPPRRSPRTACPVCSVARLARHVAQWDAVVARG